MDPRRYKPAARAVFPPFSFPRLECLPHLLFPSLGIECRSPGRHPQLPQRFLLALVRWIALPSRFSPVLTPPPRRTLPAAGLPVACDPSAPSGFWCFGCVSCRLADPASFLTEPGAASHTGFRAHHQDLRPLGARVLGKLPRFRLLSALPSLTLAPSRARCSTRAWWSRDGPGLWCVTMPARSFTAHPSCRAAAPPPPASELPSSSSAAEVAPAEGCGEYSASRCARCPR